MMRLLRCNRLLCSIPLTPAFFGTVAVVLGVATASGVSAAEFPYQATVSVDRAEVRSGPGEGQFYVTTQLERGQEVTVMRHDPGGWRMIQPPTGSFSYIRPEHVNDLGDGRGVVSIAADPSGRASRAVVRIGSQFSDDASLTGRYLKSGDEVTILGRAVVTVGGQSREMLRILPPPREYRWIRGDALGTTELGTLTATARDLMADTVGFGEEPKSSGSERPDLVLTSPADGERIARPEAVAPMRKTELEAQVEVGVGSGAARLSGQSPSQARADRERLSGIDRRFRAMVTAPPEAWDLDSLYRDYVALRDGTGSETVQSMVAKRLAAIEKRREVYERFEEFRRLTSQTAAREAELLSQQQALETTVPPGGATGTDSIPSTEPIVPFGETPEPAFPAAGIPATPAGPVTYSGAGMVVEQQLGASSQYLLVSPTGRTLAVLRPRPGVSLKSHVGQARGVVGDRRPDERLGLDVIVVERLDEVRLADGIPSVPAR